MSVAELKDCGPVQKSLAKIVRREELKLQNRERESQKDGFSLTPDSSLFTPY